MVTPGSSYLHLGQYCGVFFTWAMIVALFVIGVFVRVYDLEGLPRHIHNDESATAIYIAPPFFQDPPDPIMWGQNNFGGHGNFGAWLASLSLRAFGGKTLWAIRMGSMVCGVLSIFFGALFVRTWLGLRAMLFFLVGVVPFHLHVHFSRTGFIYIQAVLFIALVAFCFGRFARRPSILNSALLGIATGLSLMVYSATYVFGGVVPLGVLAVLCSQTARERLQPNSLIQSCGIVAALSIGLTVSFGQFVYHARTDGFSSRLEQQSIFREEVRREVSANLGRGVSFLEVAKEHFATTLSFFWVGDRSVQYGIVCNPLSMIPTVILLLGLMILLFRCFKLDPAAIFVGGLAGATLVGSSFMVERNFAPHLVAFGLILPMVSALALETLCRVGRVRSSVAGMIVAIGLFIPWAHWNYELYTQFDREKRNLDVFTLHLPIQRESVKRIVNYSHLTMDLAESFYMLRYPNARRAATPDADVQTELTSLIGGGECPCIAVISADHYSGVPQLIEASQRSFREFSFGQNEVKIVYIQ